MSHAYVSLAEAGKLFPKPLTKQSILRRVRIGIRGIRLQAICDGKEYFTTQEWVDEFIAAITAERIRPDVPNVKTTPPELSMLRFQAMRHYDPK